MDLKKGLKHDCKVYLNGRKMRPAYEVMFHNMPVLYSHFAKLYFLKRK